LVAADGTHHPAQAIYKTTRHVGRFTKYTRVGGTIKLPAKVGDSLALPVEVKVGSDDLQEDVTYVEAKTEMTLKREAPARPPF